MATSRKKVIVRTHSPSGPQSGADVILPGYLPLNGIVSVRSGTPSVDLFNLEGRIAPVPLSTVRCIAYVRDFNLNDRVDPERLARRTFLARPRAEGLWVRLTLTTGDILEGLAATDTSLADSLIDDHGLYLTPPDIRSNTQRLFIPRTAFTQLQLLAVITTPSKSKPTTRLPQDTLF